MLVALGSKASDEVMAELLQMLVPGTLPHYFVVLTLANLATENGIPSDIIYISLTFLKLLINEYFFVFSEAAYLLLQSITRSHIFWVLIIFFAECCYNL